MADIKWQTPPPAKTRTSVFTEEIREALRSREGDWALVYNTSAQSLASQWSRTYGPLGFEFTSRTAPGTKPKRYDVYARFNPEAVSA